MTTSTTYRRLSIGLALALVAALAGIVLLLLTRERKGETASSAPTPPAAPSPPSSTKLQAENECLLGGFLVLQVLMPIHYTKPTPSESRQLYRFRCPMDTKVCTGAVLWLDQADKGEPIGRTELLEIDDHANVVSVVGKTAVIQWGTRRTFTIDFVHGTIAYVESGRDNIGWVEGRGEATCDPYAP